ncbi:MAG: tetraacyldisaccharide 4'-kinase, partial [Granulosicoccaceae bacterium]
MKAPTHWTKRGPLAMALLPVAGLFAGLGSLRRAAYNRGWLESTHAGVTTVIVGNINVGGTGKTPTVIKLQSIFNELGVTAHVVSKGYGGSEEGPLRVDEALHTASDVGDEPLLLAAFG